LQQDLVVCEQCNAVHRWRPLGSAEVAHCSRCAAVLARGHRLGVHAMLALTIAALAVLLIANLTTIVDIRLRGAHTAATLPEAIRITWSEGERLVATVAALTAIVAPALLVALRLAVVVPLAWRRPWAQFAGAMRALHEISRWSMVEVMMVAAAVSIVRIASMAHATPGPGMFAFGALALLLAALESGGLRHLWLERP
jgi:paraquat-inducible protein A